MQEERRFRSAFSAKLRVGTGLPMQQQRKFAAMATTMPFKIVFFPKAGSTITMISSLSQEAASYQECGK